MGRQKARYQETGRLRTIYTVNFGDHVSILQTIEPLMRNTRVRTEIFKLGLGILNHIQDNDVIEDCIGHVTKLLGALTSCNKTPVDMRFFMQTVGSFVASVPIDQQLPMYKLLGAQLNTPLWDQSKRSPNLEHVDIAQLLTFSSQDMYNEADQRLKVFIEEAVKTSKTEKYGSEAANAKKENFCHNIIENFLKARNLRFVSHSGLSLLTLVYIFSGRSTQTCNLVAATGAKGTYKIVTQFVLPNSRNTSYKSSKDGVTVYYSFDNIQKISKIWRVHGSKQDQSLAKVATSIVHCYPDGLLNLNVQYVLRHSPMLWLYELELDNSTHAFYDKLDKNVIEKILKLDDRDMDIILGRWDFTIQTMIDEVKGEVLDGKDEIEKILELKKKSEENNVKFCILGHRNEKPRSNQKYCKTCKQDLMERVTEEDSYSDDNEKNDYASGKYKRIKISNNETGPIEAALVDVEETDKGILYPRIRNIFNENLPKYESEGTVFVNPNKFIRVKIVLDHIQKVTNTDKNENTLVVINDDGSITTKIQDVNNIRSWILVTLDGLPHKIAIDVIKHCFKCAECGKEFTVSNDVAKHF